MQQYIGTKRINAKPMARQEYNDFRGWQLPADEDGSDEGFLVEYLDGGQANTTEYSGYVSWSPKAVFEKVYRPTTSMTFGDALVMLKAGNKVCRAGWNGKGMWLDLVINIHDVPVGGTYGPVYRLSTEEGFHGLPWIGMKTADEKFVPWLASQTDMLSKDWMLVG